MVKTLLLDKNNNKLVEVYVSDPNDYKEIRKYIPCDYLDAPLHKIGHKLYHILADDDGWPRDGEEKDEQISAIASFGSPLIYGNLMFFNHNGDLLAGLTDEDVTEIKKHITEIKGIGLVLVI